jgi:hypothetical protein
MKLIALTRGLSAMVDDNDFDWLSQWRWQAMKSGRNFYASRDVRIGPRRENKRIRILMHRVILGIPVDLQVDHRDMNTLNNQRPNLRAATRAQNNGNRRSHRGSTSRYKGVFWSGQAEKWQARIIVDSRQVHLGLFVDEAAAARAYDAAAREHFREFARLNFEGAL